MQKVVYECDWCREVIGDQAHITLVLQTNHPGTGVAIPPKTGLAGQKGASGWRTVKLDRNFLHFHFGCVASYFRNVERVATGKVKKDGKK